MRTARTQACNSLAAVVLAAGAALAAGTPEPETLLDAALAPPAVSYQGRVMVAQWFGKQTHAEEMRVYVLPPDKVRREFLAPDGSVERVSVSDGEKESVTLARTGRTVVGNAVGSDEKVLPAEREREILLSNYELSSSTGEKVAGRPTWRLTLRPRLEGKPWQTLWLDRETSVILRRKRSLPHRPFASQAQFVAFEPRKPLGEELFRVGDASAGAVAARGLEPEFLTLERINKITGDRARFPAALPGGFVFESAGVFPIGKSTVRHARYTDGLIVISLFQTDRPVRLPKGNALPPGDARLPGPLRATREGKVIQWNAGGRHYTLMGDISQELVADIVKSLR